jgi:hypothetical protein
MIHLLRAFVLVPESFELFHDLILLPDPLVDDEQDRVEREDGPEDYS